MKILFYINQLSDGGAERVIANLANHYNKTGHEVIVVNSYPTDNEYSLEQSIHQIYLEDKNTSQSFGRRNIKRIKKLRYILKKEQPDITVAFLKESIFRLLIANVGLRSKVLVSVRNDPERAGYGSGKYKYLTKFIFPLADRIVFQTIDAQAWFPEKIRERSEIIINPVRDEFFDFTDDLYIYGQGEQYTSLTNTVHALNIEQRVHFVGNVDDVAGCIKGAKLFVMSSDYEGMPNALMEAMALGLPCIATDCPCGGPRMLIQSGENGVLIPVGDQKKLEEVMRELLSNSEKAEKIGMVAKKSAQQYKTNVIYEQWDRCIFGMLSWKGKRSI